MMETSLERAWRLIEDLGIGKPVPRPDYEKALKANFGAAGKKYLSASRNWTAGQSVDLYAPKNANLALSSAVTSQYLSVHHAQFLAWLMNEELPPPQRVLDLGCEAGFLTCALAKIFPQAKIVGVDQEERAIRVAQELALKHELKNVTFEICTIEAFAQEALKEPFDLVIGAWVFHEPMGMRLDRNFEWKHADSIDRVVPLADEHVALLKSVSNLMAPQARLIAVNRWASSSKTLYWVRVCEAAGLTLDPARSFMLEVSCEFEGDEKFPITVLSKEERVSSVRPDDILGLHAYPYFRDHEEWCRVEGESAEAIFRSLIQEDLIYSATLEYLDGPGTEFLSVFLSGALIVRYRTTTLGYREVILSAIALLPSVLGPAIAYVEEREPYAEITQAFPARNVDLLKSYGCILS
jgi:predicted RNA methylase